MKRLLGKVLLLWAGFTAIGYVIFPVIALLLTFGANFYNLIYKNDGTIRAYFSLKPGTPLFSNPVRGNTPSWITTGESIVEQTRIILPGEAYTNPDDYWRDSDSYHRVCMRLSTSPADVVAFAANRGCFWLRNRNGEQYEQILTVPVLRAEWNRLEDINKNKPVEMAYPPLIPALETIAPYSGVLALIMVVMNGVNNVKRHRRQIAFA